MSEKYRDGDILQSKFLAHKEAWSGQIELRYGYQTVGEGWTSAQPLSMAKQEWGTIIAPFLVINAHEAQTLMDSLWECGIRPSEGSGSAGAMAATQAHLRDLQRIVFKGKP